MTTVIDLQRWKEDHDLAALVEEVTHQQIGPDRKVRCPFHDDRTPSLHIYPDGRWKCFGCGTTGDHYDFLGLLWFGEGYNLKDVLDRLGTAPQIYRHVPPQAQPQDRLRPTLDIAAYEKLEANIGDRELAYWRQQKLSARTVLQFRVGFTGRRYAFPWFYRGVLAAVKLRRDDDLCPDLEPKYISLKGSRFAAPFNIDAVLANEPEHILVVEDEKSVMAAYQHGLVAISTPANSFKQEWIDLLAHVPHIIAVADWDGPGAASAHKIAGLCRRASVVTASGYFPDGRRATDLHDCHMAGLDIRQVVGL